MHRNLRDIKRVRAEVLSYMGQYNHDYVVMRLMIKYNLSKKAAIAMIRLAS